MFELIKQSLKSRTVKLGLALTIASITQMLVPFFPPAYIGIAGTLIGITVIVLRFLTTLPLSEK